MKSQLFPVNLQQGFVLNGGRIVGAYSHHTKEIFLQVPYFKFEVKLPKEISKYTIIDKQTGHFSISRWTIEGNKEL